MWAGDYSCYWVTVAAIRQLPVLLFSWSPLVMVTEFSGCAQVFKILENAWNEKFCFQGLESPGILLQSLKSLEYWGLSQGVIVQLTIHGSWVWSWANFITYHIPRHCDSKIEHDQSACIRLAGSRHVHLLWLQLARSYNLMATVRLQHLELSEEKLHECAYCSRLLLFERLAFGFTFSHISQQTTKKKHSTLSITCKRLKKVRLMNLIALRCK